MRQRKARLKQKTRSSTGKWLKRVELKRKKEPWTCNGKCGGFHILCEDRMSCYACIEEYEPITTFHRVA